MSYIRDAQYVLSNTWSAQYWEMKCYWLFIGNGEIEPISRDDNIKPNCFHWRKMGHIYKLCYSRWTFLPWKLVCDQSINKEKKSRKMKNMELLNHPPSLTTSWPFLHSGVLKLQVRNFWNLKMWKYLWSNQDQPWKMGNHQLSVWAEKKSISYIWPLKWLLTLLPCRPDLIQTSLQLAIFF